MSGYGSALACDGSTAEVTGCTFASNGGVYGSAVYLEFSNATISACTMHWNYSQEYSGQVHCAENSVAVLDRVIIATSLWGKSAHCDPGSSISASCCDFYHNPVGDWVGCLEGQDGVRGNISAEPLFCDTLKWDFTIEDGSPCAPERNPECGLVGAWPVGCGTPTPIGGCCLAGGTCQVLSGDECSQQHGTYQGDDIPCDPSPCQPIPTRVKSWGRIKALFRDAPR